MKAYELDAMRIAVKEITPQARELTAAAREEVLYARYEADGHPDRGHVDYEALVNSLTVVESIEVVYRILGRALDNVSGWRKMLRWAIRKVMDLLLAAKDV